VYFLDTEYKEIDANYLHGCDRKLIANNLVTVEWPHDPFYRVCVHGTCSELARKIGPTTKYRQ
jgi:hypothetical protein